MRSGYATASERIHAGRLSLSVNLKYVLQPKLNLPRICNSFPWPNNPRARLPVRSVKANIVRKTQIVPIENVKELRAELEKGTFGNSKALVHGEIEIHLSRPNESISTHVAIDSQRGWLEGTGIMPPVSRAP